MDTNLGQKWKLIYEGEIDGNEKKKRSTGAHLSLK